MPAARSPKGKFIVFEGGEGSGKSSLTKKLSEYLTKKKIKHIITREPGGTPEAEAIRALLVEGAGDKFDKTAETLLFCAARRHHVVNKIAPALAKGEWVLCDRFTDSTLVYQGYAHGLKLESVKRLNQLATEGVKPNLTLLCDVKPELGLSRSKVKKSEQRFESLDLSFHKKVRKGFLDIAKANPKSHVIIDSDQTVDGMWEDALALLQARFTMLR